MENKITYILYRKPDSWSIYSSQIEGSRSVVATEALYRLAIRFGTVPPECWRQRDSGVYCLWEE